MLRAVKSPSSFPEPSVQGDPRTIRNALIIICLGALMSSVDATVTNIALSTLEHRLDATVAGVQWVMTAYLLTVAGVIPVSGWASRRLGARQIYVASLALFGISSALCAMSASLQMLVACRLLQGLAGGMLVPIGQLIAAEVAGPDRMGKMVSRIWTFSSIGAMVGPTLGGAILESLGWRWIFMINVPICVIATLAAVHLLPRTPTRPAGKLDLGGLLRLSIGVPAMVFALAQAEQSGSPLAPAAVLPMVAGVVLVLDFIRHALRSSAPLLDIRLCARPAVRAGLVTIFVVDIVWFGVLVLIPLAFQQVLGLSPMAAGMLMAPQGVGTAAGIWCSGRMGDTRRSRNLGAIGTALLVATTMAIATVATLPVLVICLVLLAAGFCAGLSWIPATAASYIGMRPDEISHGSPLVTVVMRLGASFGTAIAAILLQANIDGNPGHPIAGAFRASFHVMAALALLAALIYVGLCRVISRAENRTVTPTRETNGLAATPVAEIAEAQAGGIIAAEKPAGARAPVVVPADHNRRHLRGAGRGRGRSRRRSVAAARGAGGASPPGSSSPRRRTG